MCPGQHSVVSLIEAHFLQVAYKGSGEIVLLLDADTRMPEDCLLDGALEMQQCPEVGYLYVLMKAARAKAHSSVNMHPVAYLLRIIFSNEHWHSSPRWSSSRYPSMCPAVTVCTISYQADSVGAPLMGHNV